MTLATHSARRARISARAFALFSIPDYRENGERNDRGNY